MPVSDFIHLMRTHFPELRGNEIEIFKRDLLKAISFLNDTQRVPLLKTKRGDMVHPRLVVEHLWRLPKYEHLVPPSAKTFLQQSWVLSAVIAMSAATPMRPESCVPPAPERNAITPAKNGRPIGTSYQELDKPLVKQMHELQRTGRAKSPTDAAWKVIGRDGQGAEGIGTPESKITRLVRLAKRTENN